MANLSNKQATSLTNLQSRQQVLLSDASAENASAQFNATSQNKLTSSLIVYNHKYKHKMHKE